MSSLEYDIEFMDPIMLLYVLETLFWDAEGDMSISRINPVSVPIIILFPSFETLDALNPRLEFVPPRVPCRILDGICDKFNVILQ
jgi:hypothetical protein